MACLQTVERTTVRAVLNVQSHLITLDGANICLLRNTCFQKVQHRKVKEFFLIKAELYVLVIAIRKHK